MEDIKQQHENHYNTLSNVVVSAPGVVNILGEYCDFSSGMIISMPITKDVKVAVSKRADNALYFYDCNKKVEKKSTLTNIKLKKNELTANYVRGVVSEILLLGLKLPGMDFSIKFDIPEGVGLNSSSACCVAIAVAIRELCSLEMTDAQVLGAAYGSLNRFMGINKTMSSFYSSYYSHKRNLKKFDPQTMAHEDLSYELHEYEALIVNSNVEIFDDDTTCEDLYRDFEICVKYLNTIKPGSSLRDFDEADLDLLLNKVPESSRRKSIHYFLEQKFLEEIEACFHQCDMSSMGRYIKRSHESIRDTLEASCPEVDWLVNRAIEQEKVSGAKHVGAVSGGCVFIIGDKGFIEDYKKVLPEYEKIFGFKAEAIPVESASIKIEHNK